MLTQPPQGSTISVTSSGGKQIISIPFARQGSAPYFVAAFLTFWLVAWVAGGVSAAGQLVSTPAGPGSAFLVFWLCAWAVGLVLVIAQLRRIFQRSIPETIEVGAAGVTHDTGIAPFRMPASRTLPWKSVFPKRITQTIDRRQLDTLRLREGDTRNRLTVDAGAQRVELASAATDVEREWLWKVLSDRYALATPK